jgi:putative lipoprotein
MRAARRLSLQIIAALFVTALWTTQSAAGATITGTAFYRERIAPGQSVVLEIALTDASAATPIAALTMTNPGDAPYSFALDYDPSRIDNNHAYEIRATLLADGRPIFATDRAIGVLTRGHGSHATLVLRSTSAAPSGAPLLEGTVWKLASLPNEAVSVDAPHPPNLVLHANGHEISGSGGCNGIGGKYILNGASIQFSQIVTTMMACLQGMQTEHAFVFALPKVDHWLIAANTLELFDKNNLLLATFAAQP